MKTTALITMIVVTAIVWGGFLSALILAIRKEAHGSSAKKPDRPLS